MAKALKSKSNFKMKSNLKISSELTRMGYFLAFLALMVHLLACFWCAMAQFDVDQNWMIGKLGSL